MVKFFVHDEEGSGRRASPVVWPTELAHARPRGMWISLMNHLGTRGKALIVTIGCLALAGCAAPLPVHRSAASASSTVRSGRSPSSSRVSPGSSSSGVLPRDRSSSPSEHSSGSSVTGGAMTCGAPIVATYGTQRLYLSSCAGNIGLSVYGPSRSVAANLANGQTATISGPLQQIITGRAQSSDPEVVVVAQQTSSQMTIVARQAGAATITVPTPYCNGSTSHACALLRVSVHD